MKDTKKKEGNLGVHPGFFCSYAFAFASFPGSALLQKRTRAVSVPRGRKVTLSALRGNVGGSGEEERNVQGGKTEKKAWLECGHAVPLYWRYWHAYG